MNIRVLTTEYLLWYTYQNHERIEKEKVTMRQLSIRLGITYPQVFRSFKELEKQGFITLKRVNNRRDRLIVITGLTIDFFKQKLEDIVFTQK